MSHIPVYPQPWVHPKLDKIDWNGLNALRRMICNIEAAEALDTQREKPSLVTHVEKPGDQEDTDMNWIGLDRRIMTRPPKPRPCKIVSGVEQMTFCLQKKLPKHLRVNEKPLFTTVEFQTGVLQEWEEEVEKLCPSHNRLRAVLRERCPSDPSSYLLQVTGYNAVLRDFPETQTLLEDLKSKTQVWIQSRLCLYKSHKLSGINRACLVQETSRANPQRANEPPHIERDFEGREDAIEIPFNQENDDEEQLDSCETTTASDHSKNEASERPSQNQDDGADLSGYNFDVRIDKFTKYNRFKEKYKPFVDIEFLGNGTFKSSAYSSMWTRHKELCKGRLCDDACTCHKILYRLTKYVLSDFLAKQKEKGSDVSNIETSGIADFFAPKFLPLLEKEYPNLSPSELIRRLADMWPLHQTQKIYGMKCNQHCKCHEEAWESLFFKGDCEKAQGGLSARRAHKRRKLCLHPDPRSTQVVSARESCFNLEKRSITPKPYEETFSTHDPLGAYFITEEGKCKVFSVFSKGQFYPKKKIYIGTIVDSVRIGSVRNRIKNHEELRDMYEEANKKPQKKLHLIFLNTEVFPRPACPPLPEKDWNSSGVWQGRNIHGWPGGAMIRNSTRQKAPGTSESNFVATGTAYVGCHQGHGDDDSSIATEQSRIPRHHTATPSKSALNSTPRAKKSVVFTCNTQVRSFDADQPTTSWIQKDKENSAEAFKQKMNVPYQEKSPTEALMDATQHGSYADLIEVLEAGCACDRDTAFSVLNEQYERLRALIKSSNNALAENPSDHLLHQCNKDLVTKKEILKIYINACTEIENTFSLGSLKAFEIRIKSLSIQKSSKIRVLGRSNVITGDAKLRTNHNEYRPDAIEEEPLGSIPRQAATECIVYNDDKNDNVYIATYCRHPVEKRELIFDVYEGLKTDKIWPIRLTSFEIPMKWICEQCQDNGPEFECTQSCSPTDPSLPAGEIKLSMRRIPCSTTELVKHIKKKIHGLVDWLVSFNQQREAPHSSPRKLTANIQSYRNVSLLHAAIELGDEELVTKLIDLGAFPRGKSGLGSPITLAARKKLKWSEMLERKNLELQTSGKCADMAGTTVQEFELETFSRILELLTRNSNVPSVPQLFIFKQERKRSNLKDDKSRDESKSDVTVALDASPQGAIASRNERPAWGSSPPSRRTKPMNQSKAPSRPSWGSNQDGPQHNDSVVPSPTTNSTESTCNVGQDGRTPTHRPSWGSASGGSSGKSSAVGSVDAGSPCKSNSHPTTNRPAWGPSGERKGIEAIPSSRRSDPELQSWVNDSSPSSASVTGRPPWGSKGASAKRTSWGYGARGDSSFARPAKRPCWGNTKETADSERAAQDKGSNPPSWGKKAETGSNRSWGTENVHLPAGESSIPGTHPPNGPSNDTVARRPSWGGQKPPSLKSTQEKRPSWDATPPGHQATGPSRVDCPPKKRRPSWGNNKEAPAAGRASLDTPSNLPLWKKSPSTDSRDRTALGGKNTQSVARASSDATFEHGGGATSRPSWGKQKLQPSKVTPAKRPAWGDPFLRDQTTGSARDDCSVKRPAWGKGNEAASCCAPEEKPINQSNWRRKPTAGSRSSSGNETVQPPTQERSVANIPSERASSNDGVAGRPSRGSQKPQPSKRIQLKRPSWGPAPDGGVARLPPMNSDAANRPSWGKNPAATISNRAGVDKSSNPPTFGMKAAARSRLSWGSRTSKSPARESTVPVSFAGPKGSADTGTNSTWGVGGGDTPNRAPAPESRTKRPSWGGQPRKTSCDASSLHATAKPAVANGDKSPQDGSYSVPESVRHDWMDVRKYPRCRLPGHCIFSKIGKCRFWHVQSDLPNAEGAIEKFKVDEKNLCVMERSGWFTAAFAGTKHNKIMYARGGKNSQISKGGVYWYPTRADASDALEMLVGVCAKTKI